MSNRKTFAAVAAASLIAGGGLFASTGSADAQWRPGWRGGGGMAHVGGRGWGGPRMGWHGGGWRGHRGWGGGGAVAAGLIGGLALGAIASSAYASPYYGGYGYYGGYAPIVTAPPTYPGLPRGYHPAYGGRYYSGGYYAEAAPRCWWERRRVALDPWTSAVRRVRICS